MKGSLLSLALLVSLNIYAQNQLFWTDFVADGVFNSTLDESPVATNILTNGTPRGIVLDTASYIFYFADGDASTIASAMFDGSSKTNLVSASVPIDVALDVQNGHIYFTDNGDDKIKRIDLDGSNLMDVHIGLGNPQAIAIDEEAGKLYYSDIASQQILRSDLNGGNTEVIISSTLTGRMALDLVNDKIYYNDRNVGQIRKANLDGTNIENVVPIGDFGGSPALDIEGGKIYYYYRVNDANPNSIRRANLDGTNIEIIVDDVPGLSDLSFFKDPNFVPIPTIGQWGLFLFGLILSCFAVARIYVSRYSLGN